MSPQSIKTADAVSIVAPARLHLGFLDLNGGLNRRFGSIGVGIKGMSTCIRLQRHADIEAVGTNAERIAETAARLLSHFQINSGVHIQVEQQIPPHQGLGSGTQMALALGMAMTSLFGVDASIEDIAIATGRGKRSGIGIGVFKYGGFIVDSGRTEQQPVPSIISHLNFPEEWQFVLAFDTATEGISGAAELQAFASLPDMSAALAAEVCRLVLMQSLPGIVEKDCAQFGRSVSCIQEIYGEYFKPVQGGLFASKAVDAAVNFLHRHGATGMGQTSWGPTGFAVFPDKATALEAVAQFSASQAINSAVRLEISSVENRPSRIHIEHAESAFSDA